MKSINVLIAISLLITVSTHKGFAKAPSQEEIKIEAVGSSEIPASEIGSEKAVEYIENTLHEFEAATEESISEPNRYKLIRYIQGFLHNVDFRNFGYGMKRFLSHNMHKNAPVALDIAAMLGTSHAVEMSLIGLYNAVIWSLAHFAGIDIATYIDVPLRGFFHIIWFPGADPLCIYLNGRYAAASLSETPENPSRFKGKVRSYRIWFMKYPIKLLNRVGSRLAIRYMDQITKGELFNNLANNFESDVIRRTYLHDSDLIEFDIKDGNGKQFLQMQYAESRGDRFNDKLILKKIKITDPDILVNISSGKLKMFVGDFGNNFLHLIKKYQHVIKQGKPENIKNDFACKQYTMNSDGSIDVEIKDHAMKVRKNVPVFDGFFYSSEYRNIKTKYNVDIEAVKRNQGTFWDGMLQAYKTPESVVEPQYFVTRTMEASLKWLNYESAIFFLGQAFDGSSDKLMSHEKAYELRSRIGNDAFENLRGAIQDAFLKQLFSTKSVESYFHAAKALFSEAKTPSYDGRYIQDIARDLFKLQPLSKELVKGFTFTLQPLRAFVHLGLSGAMMENWVEIDNWLMMAKKEGLIDLAKSAQKFIEDIRVEGVEVTDRTIKVHSSKVSKVAQMSFDADAFHLLQHYYLSGQEGNVLEFSYSEVYQKGKTDVIEFAESTGYKVPEYMVDTYHASKSFEVMEGVTMSKSYQMASRESSLVRTEKIKKTGQLSIESYRAMTRRLMRAKFWKKILKR